jgi:UDP-N-acetylmuramoyl-tripeptide--D-alanyl-D-alanine ligase
MENFYKLYLKTTGICTDTRKIQKGCMFICLKGDNFNGNKFAKDALEAGARYVVVDETEADISENTILVENCLSFLQQLANYHRNQFSIPVIGITGSNGKTSTKELIHQVLSTECDVLATIGNLNNHIGVPLTLLRLNKQHEIVIIEMGANRFKDIAELCEIAEPTHAIITNIGKAHLEGFINFEGVLTTKKELYDSVEQMGGHIIYNSDDNILTDILPKSTKNLSYGTSDNCDIKGTLLGLTPYVRLSWKTQNYQSPVIDTHMVGKYNFYNFLAAIAFGIQFQIKPENINSAIGSYIPENNRSQIKKTDHNTLILDCYNANPTSMKSALESFAMIDNPDKVFIIGDMLELGNQEMAEHETILSFAQKSGLKGYTVGPRFEKISSNSVIQSFKDKDEAVAFLRSNPIRNALILIKGSRGIGLETLENDL